MPKRILALLAFALVPLAALAQAGWPTKPVKLVVPFPAGGPTDVLARAVGDRLGARVGQPIVVENKPGAGGAIGTDFVAKSAPDGYTIVLATSSTHAVNPYLSKVPYDPQKDFTPIIWLGDAQRVLVVPPSLGVNNLQELIALAKKNPGKLNYSSSGVGSVVHLATEQFASLAGIRLTHVPYKGIQQSVPDLLSGQVAILFDNIMTVQQHVKSGRLKALGVSGTTPSPLLPGVPPVAQTLPGFESKTWFGLYGPAGLPPAIAERLNRELNAVLQEPGVRERFDQLGFEPAGGSAAQFERMVQADAERWKKVIRENNVKAE
ncbi:MAG TPA: tripartite tricarboxylate transporter substrate binding protein [Usitatibacter sp.]|nr:tripartite tricarboxylate transporter substrate binding protein [Usitatibacter sp.]